MGCATSDGNHDDNDDVQILLDDFVAENGFFGLNLDHACSEALYFDSEYGVQRPPEAITRIKYEENCSHEGLGSDCERYHIEWYYSDLYKSVCYQVVLKDDLVRVVHPSVHFQSERDQGGNIPLRFRQPISPPMIEDHKAIMPKKDKALIDQLKESLMSGALQMGKDKFMTPEELRCPFSTEIMQSDEYPADILQALQLAGITGCGHKSVFDAVPTKSFKGVPAKVASLKGHCERVIVRDTGKMLFFPPESPARVSTECLAHLALHQAMKGVSYKEYQQELQDLEESKK